MLVVVALLPLSLSMYNGELDHGGRRWRRWRRWTTIGSKSSRQQERWRLHDSMRWQKRTVENNATTNQQRDQRKQAVVGGNDGNATAGQQCNSNYDGRRWTVQRQCNGNDRDGARRQPKEQ
jgi:hypothetical protein